MKKLFLLFALILMGLAGCKTKSGTFLIISNPLDMDRIDARILITHDQMKLWTEIPEDKLPLLLEENSKPVACQVDDLDNDGQWDELFAVIDMKPLEERKVKLVFRDSGNYPEFTDRTNVRLGANKPGYPELTKAERLEGVSYHNHGLTGQAYQMEGPAWENDFVGFRNYLDQRNGMDIFGKLTTEMVLDSVGIEGRGSYHEPADWGMDILKVGTSLGAGSIAYYYNDSLYRVGDNGKGMYELVVDGTLRSIFLLGFRGWEIEGTALDVNQYIEIQAGNHYYESSVSYSGTGLSPDLVTGIVNMKSKQLLTKELNEDFMVFLTHDYQAEDTTLLGMGLMVPVNSLIEYGRTKDAGEGITETDRKSTRLNSSHT